MTATSAIVLVIDRLGAAYLGPYGNTWLDTPGFNRLASESLLCEQMLAASPDLAATYHEYWLGKGSDPSSLPLLARAAGCRTVLLTDDETVAQFPGAHDFDELQLVQPPPEWAHRNRPAHDVADTGFIRLMEAAVAQLEAWKDSPQPQLLWIHARAMNGPWDAPQELREQFADEDDPPAADCFEPPNEVLPADHDPDEVLSITHAYAGQVAVVELGLQALLTAIDELPQRDSLLLAVTSPRGFPLGEHLRLGECDQALYGELLHVPGIVRFPQQEGELLRSHELIQPADFYATLADVGNWTTDPEVALRSLLRIVRGEPAVVRELVTAAGPHQRLVRTTAWQLRIVGLDEREGEEERYELYVKPDDRYEFNDVASRAGDIVAQLAERITSSGSEKLATELTSPWR